MLYGYDVVIDIYSCFNYVLLILSLRHHRAVKEAIEEHFVKKLCAIRSLLSNISLYVRLKVLVLCHVNSLLEMKSVYRKENINYIVLSSN